MTTARDQLGKADTITIAAIEAGVPALIEARNLIDRFQRMIRRKAKAELDPWIADARHSLLAPFANGILKDKAAVSAAITEPNHRLRSIFAKSSSLVADAGLGQSWDELRVALGKIRKDGYSFTHGEFNPGVVGVAAPIFNSEKLILGSVGVAWQEEDLQDVDQAMVVLAVKRAAREITQKVASATPGMDLLPRAVG